MSVRGPPRGAMVLGWAELPAATVPSPGWVMHGSQETVVTPGSQQRAVRGGGSPGAVHAERAWSVLSSSA